MKLNRTVRSIQSFWYRYWFNRNLRDFVRLIRYVKLMINCRELNRELGIGGARKYTYDTEETSWF